MADTKDKSKHQSKHQTNKQAKDNAKAQAAAMLADGKCRCDWCHGHPIYIKYHDEEWGVPVHDDRKHFESIVLDGAQAGLSWLTILKKRENYRKAFDNFDVNKVAKYNEAKVKKLLQDAGIVRNQFKIRSAIRNAKAFQQIQKEFGSFDKYIWQWSGHGEGGKPGKPIMNSVKGMKDLPATSELSDKVSKDLQKRGFNFVGSTIIYAYLEAIGVVNDHFNSCWRKKKC